VPIGQESPQWFLGACGSRDQWPVFTAYRSLREWLLGRVLRALCANCGRSAGSILRAKRGTLEAAKSYSETLKSPHRAGQVLHVSDQVRSI
jgi:hypothetical protein